MSTPEQDLIDTLLAQARVGDRFAHVEAALRSLVERAEQRGQETIPTVSLRRILDSMP